MTDPFPSPFRDPGAPADAEIPGHPTDGLPGTVPAGDVSGPAHDGPVDAARRRRLVLLLVGAGLLVVGGGATAAVSLLGLPGTGDDAVVADAGPQPSPSASATPSVTGQATSGIGDVPASDAGGTGAGAGEPAVGRNVFAPLVDADAAPTAGSSGTAPAGPTTAPPADTVALPSVRTVTVPGAVVTSTQIIAGPTATTTRTVTSTADAGYEVEVVSVADTASATSAVTFAVDGSPVSVAAGGSFGPAGAFTYTGYDTVDDLVAFTNGSVSVTLPVGASIVFP